MTAHPQQPQDAAQPAAQPPKRVALVLGGSGAVGQAIVRGLTAAHVPVVFTFCHNKGAAQALAQSTGAQAEHLDLTEAGALAALVGRCVAAGVAFGALVCAVGLPGPAALADADDATAQAVWAVNVQGALAACRLLVPLMTASGGGEVVMLNALDRGQSLPLPPLFAATQGALPALAMSLARAHGAQGVRANVVALGLLERGLSAGLDPALVEDYKRFSALRRLGAPEEVARVVVWLVTQNSYVNGKVIPANGGI